MKRVLRSYLLISSILGQYVPAAHESNEQQFVPMHPAELVDLCAKEQQNSTDSLIYNSAGKEKSRRPNQQEGQRREKRC